ncbi:hypothetical protein AALP_AA1G079200 [Arabis alpina]|uniref:Bifunctional inhibitor/plant lipid transfer protein/seed storage helical domain-containing protein n=1 Tax=Arabis alpina TaxID=50452 RepID=A0A087HLU3_ARAAL|nr:hypothetical protein AALP_AA1G079200 [Arabis alpina]
MKFSTLACIAFVVVVVSSLAPTKAVVGSEKVACNVMELQPCLAALQSGGNPSPDCCGKLKEQESCLCEYIKNPLFGQYVSSANAQKILGACGVPLPTCK